MRIRQLGEKRPAASTMTDQLKADQPAGIGPSSGAYDYHAYVIYADADADDCISQLIKPLEAAGLRVIHKGAYVLGRNVFRTEDESIQKSLCTIAFLTPEWVKSNQDTFLADRAGAVERLVPVIAEDCDPDPRIRDLTKIDLRRPDRWQEEFQRLLRHLGQSAQDALALAAQTVVRGLKALSKLMRNPQVEEAVSGYEVSFTLAASEIDGIGRLKALHDGFQSAEGSFRLLAERRARIPAPPAGAASLGDELEEGLHDLLADLGQILKTADSLGMPLHMVAWTPQLDAVGTALDRALASADANLLGKPLEELERLLGILPSRINQRIVEGVARLSLRRVADELRSVHDSLSEYRFDELAEALFDDFAKSVDSLGTLARNLEALHANHDWLQQVSDSLAPLQRNRRPAKAEIQTQWQFVTGPVSELDAAAGPSWVSDFQARADEATKALEKATDPAGVRALHLAFNMFRTELDKVFNRADRDLLTLCEKLKTVGHALRNTIQRMKHG
jgi:hypothetical protein